MSLKILYRGLLASCNYACSYCPFGHQEDTASALAQDREDLQRFTQWLDHQGASGQEFEVFLTPYGEALIHPWYQRAIIELSHGPYIKKIAIQTNLSCDLKWLEACNPGTTALWISYHPDFAKLKEFLEKCQTLKAMGVSHSVGVVGIKEQFPAIAELRRQLQPGTYLWINAFKHQGDYYSSSDLSFLESIDPYFSFNLHRYPSFGKACGAGHSVVSIDGKGDLYRCHFIKEKRGNIYRDTLATLLKEAPCTAQTCHCHIGYVHLDFLGMDRIFGPGILERVPLSYSEARDERS